MIYISGMFLSWGALGAVSTTLTLLTPLVHIHPYIIIQMPSIHFLYLILHPSNYIHHILSLYTMLVQSTLTIAVSRCRKEGVCRFTCELLGSPFPCEPALCLNLS